MTAAQGWRAGAGGERRKKAVPLPSDERTPRGLRQFRRRGAEAHDDLRRTLLRQELRELRSQVRDLHGLVEVRCLEAGPRGDEQPPLERLAGAEPVSRHVAVGCRARRAPGCPGRGRCPCWRAFGRGRTCTRPLAPRGGEIGGELAAPVQVVPLRAVTLGDQLRERPAVLLRGDNLEPGAFCLRGFGKPAQRHVRLVLGEALGMGAAGRRRRRRGRRPEPRGAARPRRAGPRPRRSAGASRRSRAPPPRRRPAGSSARSRS